MQRGYDTVGHKLCLSHNQKETNQSCTKEQGTEEMNTSHLEAKYIIQHSQSKLNTGIQDNNLSKSFSATVQGYSVIYESAYCTKDEKQ